MKVYIYPSTRTMTPANVLFPSVFNSNIWNASLLTLIPISHTSSFPFVVFPFACFGLGEVIPHIQDTWMGYQGVLLFFSSFFFFLALALVVFKGVRSTYFTLQFSFFALLFFACFLRVSRR